MPTLWYQLLLPNSQPSPPTLCLAPSSHHRENIVVTVLDLFAAKSNKRLNLLQKGTSPNHLSHQNKVYVPSPTFRDILSKNRSPSTSPTTYLIFPPPKRNTPAPTSNFTASSPYLATNTLYHKPPLSTNNLQHHFPINAKFNSLNCLTPKPPCSFRKQIVF